MCHRYLWKGLCPCSDEECVGNATVVSSIGMVCDASEANKVMCDFPLDDPVVLDFVKKQQAKSTNKGTCCEDRQFSHVASDGMEKLKEMKGLR
eukprot:9334510-Ditylum_brightwellii.AAC.1